MDKLTRLTKEIDIRMKKLASGDRHDIKVGDTVGNTVDGFDFIVLKVEGEKLTVKDKLTGKVRTSGYGNMYKRMSRLASGKQNFKYKGIEYRVESSTGTFKPAKPFNAPTTTYNESWGVCDDLDLKTKKFESYVDAKRAIESMIEASGKDAGIW